MLLAHSLASLILLVLFDTTDNQHIHLALERHRFHKLPGAEANAATNRLSELASSGLS